MPWHSPTHGIAALGNIDTVVQYAAQNGLAGVPLAAGSRYAVPADDAAPTCNSYSGPGVLAFTKRLLNDLGC